MFHLFRSVDRKRSDVADASRRNDEAHDDLKAALERLLAERNAPGKPKERQK